MLKSAMMRLGLMNPMLRSFKVWSNSMRCVSFLMLRSRMTIDTFWPVYEEARNRPSVDSDTLSMIGVVPKASMGGSGAAA